MSKNYFFPGDIQNPKNRTSLRHLSLWSSLAMEHPRTEASNSWENHQSKWWVFHKGTNWISFAG